MFYFLTCFIICAIYLYYSFPDDIELLAKIPLSPKLLLGSDYVNEGNESERTLLSWICTQVLNFYTDSVLCIM